MPAAHSTPRRCVRWLGPSTGSEFGTCHAEIAGSHEVGFVDHEDADLTVVACPRPTVDLKKISDLTAVGPVVQLLGVWCEGEGRTGRVASEALRVFWHEWPSWWRRWLHGPSTLADEHRLVRIDSPDRELAAAMLAAFAAEGVAAVWGRRPMTTEPTLVVWDGKQLNGREADQLLRVCRAGVPVIALLDFPRPETVAAAQALGATAVLGKPFERPALLELIRHTLQRSAPPTCTAWLEELNPVQRETPVQAA